jgi:hypothetical protein
MISGWLISCDASPSDNDVPKNPIDADRRTFCKDPLLITGQNRFARRKNPSNKPRLGFSGDGEIGEKTEAQ